MKRKIKRRESKTYLDLSTNKNYKVKTPVIDGLSDNVFIHANKFTKGGDTDGNEGSGGTGANSKFSNVMGAIGAVGGAAVNIAQSSIANAEVDTSTADNAIQAVNNQKLDTSSLDALATSYNNTPWAAEEYDFKDFRPGAGELVMNTLNAGMSGFSGGASSGSGWAAAAGAAIGLGSAIGGMFAGRAKAKREARMLENEAEVANLTAQTKAEASRDAIIQNQANSFLQNIAAEGGQLNFKEGEEYDLSYKDIYKLKNKGYDMFRSYKVNDEIEIDPSELEDLKNLGYEFEII